MRNKLYWGLGVLIFLIIGATVFVYVKDQAEIRELEKNLADAKKLEEESNKVQHVVSKADEKSPDAPHDTQASDEHFIKAPIPSGTPENSIPAAVAASDEVPKYAELKAMSEEELIALKEASYKEMERLSPELDKSWDALAQAPEGSEEQKRLQEAQDKIVWQYNVHAITSRKAFQVWQLGFIEFMNNEFKKLPYHFGQKTFYSIPDTLVD